MRKLLTGAGALAAVALLAGAAGAQMHGGPSPMPGGMGPGAMGHMMGMGGCPGMTPAPQGSLTEEKAGAAAQAYADTHLKGFVVEKVLPFTGMHGPMYSVEMKGPNDEVRTFHVNPWGHVMPFGGPARRTG
jgi:hypothetical protein